MINLYVNLSAQNPAQAFVKSFTENVAPGRLSFVRGDSDRIRINFLREAPPGSGRPFDYVNPDGWGVTIAGGVIGQKPSAGAFKLSVDGVEIDDPLPLTADASDIQGAIDPLMVGVIVSGGPGGPWQIFANNPSHVYDLTGDPALLSPAGSTIEIIKTATANGSHSDQWRMRLLAPPLILREDGWESFAFILPQCSVLQAGSGTANKVFKVEFAPVQFASTVYGGVYFLKFTANSIERTLGPFLWDASAQYIRDTFAAHPEVATPDGVEVNVAGIGNYTVECRGPAIDHSDDPQLADGASDLLFPYGVTEALTVDRAGADAILNGAPVAEITLEIQISEQPGQRRTCARTTADLYGDLIIP